MAISTADLHDAHPDRVDVIDLQFRAFGAHACFHGQVATLRVLGDHRPVRVAVEAPGDGWVLVVDGGGDLSVGLFGDRIATRAIERGWAGVVVIGAIRDSAVIDTLPIGVRALGTTARRSAIERRGEAGTALRIADTIVRPGFWLYADRDAVIVSPDALEIVARG